jgi:hypothetical protein
MPALSHIPTFSLTRPQSAAARFIGHQPLQLRAPLNVGCMVPIAGFPLLPFR